MAQNETVDVLIVGAGPAGLSTALHLVQGQPGWAKRVLVLEKKTHPRPKLCGGGITRSGLMLFKDLGISLPLPLPQARVDHVLIQYKKRTIHVRGKPQFVVINRPEFDHFLFQIAQEKGIQIHQNEPVVSLAREDGLIRVTTPQTSYLARVVVGADSARGRVRTWLESERKDGKSPRRIGRTLEVLIPADLGSPRFRQHSAIFDFSHIHQDLQGYSWDFPSYVEGEPTHNLGVYDARFLPTRPKAKLPALLDRGVRKVATTDHQPQSAPIRWYSPWRPISAAGLVLVGDAAGVEGLFGEGISPALAYGKVAAKEIQRAFAAHDFSFQSYERQVLRSSLGRYLMIRWLLANALYRFGNSGLFMHSLWTAGQILATIWRAGPLE